ncbi:MAG: GapR family DNA-binding domain-containing protein [Devosia sp.]|uniref:DUF2312 domain-containing protein n=1 Tax=Devosia sp. TaxID=1871048 RepID=UPI00339239B2
MAVEDSVAQDQIRAFIERIERMEAEKAAIASDIKEIYAEAKGNGFDTKILRKLVTIRKQDANERMEQEALLELYMGALGMIELPTEDVYDGERERLNSIAAQLRAAPIKPKSDPLAALRADPAMAIVAPADITPKSNLQNVQSAQTEPRPTKAAGGDLTALAPNDGQVAPTQPEAANEKPESSDIGASDPQRSVEAIRKDAFSDGSGPHAYAAPGIVTWESTPPEGVERHPYSNAFGTLGQDAVVIADDIAMAKAAPIVKMGNVILDGWARYMTARGSVGLTGQSTEYQVVQYDGDDALLDCIRWNVDGRILSSKDKQTIVNRLSVIEPKRKADIIKAVAELAI